MNGWIIYFLFLKCILNKRNRSVDIVQIMIGILKKEVKRTDNTYTVFLSSYDRRMRDVLLFTTGHGTCGCRIDYLWLLGTHVVHKLLVLHKRLLAEIASSRFSGLIWRQNSGRGRRSIGRCSVEGVGRCGLQIGNDRHTFILGRRGRHTPFLLLAVIQPAVILVFPLQRDHLGLLFERIRSGNTVGFRIGIIVPTWGPFGGEVQALFLFVLQDQWS